MQNPRFGRSCLGSLLLTVVMMTASDGQQRKGFPEPPAPAVPETQTPPDSIAYRRMATLEMEREARELSALAASIPNDVELVKKGLLPRDVTDKLKRIEKLSKQLRGQIHP